MQEQRILIVGGYGIVGKDVVKILSKHPDFKIYIAGRNIEKAQIAAAANKCDWKYIDVNDNTSIKEALKNINIVVNCFIGMDKINVSVAEIVAETGKKYIDVAGVPLEHQYKIKELDQKAKNSGALLITGFGVNPGIVGILINHHAKLLSDIEKTEVFFTMGSNFNDISVLSLTGIGDLMQIPPQVWKKNNWIDPEDSFKKQYIGSPFNKRLYFGPGAITPDIKRMKSLDKINRIEFWSGIESLWASMILFYGVKKGKTKTKEKATLLLKRLKRIGNRKKYKSDTNLTIRSWGIKGQTQSKAETSFYCTEVFATALAPSIGCSLIYEGKIDTSGAFYATEVVNPSDFVEKLENSNINFNESLEIIE
jgi:saccharopine dehydrogenase-like NADP-dependent oxidoreductase